MNNTVDVENVSVLKASSEREKNMSLSAIIFSPDVAELCDGGVPFSKIENNIIIPLTILRGLKNNPKYKIVHGERLITEDMETDVVFMMFKSDVRDKVQIAIRKNESINIKEEYKQKYGVKFVTPIIKINVGLTVPKENVKIYLTENEYTEDDILRILENFKQKGV